MREQREMGNGRAFALVAAWIVGLGLVIGGVSIGLNAAGLLYLPFMYHQQTAIVHASQGYIDAQRQQLRAFKSDYDTATTDFQRAADIRQMRELADLLPPEYIQPDVAALLRERQ
jgi:hypothetical protein